MFDWPPSLSYLLFWLAGAAGFGGLTKFLYAVGRGHIRNNKHLRKALLEVAGGTFVGFFVSLLFSSWEAEWRLFTAFGIGVAWAEILQIVRRKITGIVETALGNVESKAKAGGPGKGKGFHQQK